LQALQFQLKRRPPATSLSSIRLVSTAMPSLAKVTILAFSILHLASVAVAQECDDSTGLMQIKKHPCFVKPTADQIVEFCGGRFPDGSDGVVGACENWPLTRWAGWAVTQPNPGWNSQAYGINITYKSKDSWTQGAEGAGEVFGSCSDVNYSYPIMPEATYLKSCTTTSTRLEAVESCNWAGNNTNPCGPDFRTTTYMWKLPDCGPGQEINCRTQPPWGGPVIEACWAWGFSVASLGVLYEY